MNLEQNISSNDIKLIWAPQRGPQEMLIDCPFPLIGFGGARGGGKTQGVLGKYGIKAERYGKHFNAIFFRKELPQADDLIEEAKAIYLPLGARWQEQKKQFTFKDGGRLRFRPLENDADAEKYQGQNLTDVGIEEAGNYASEAPIFKLFGALRSQYVPIQMILTFNPGGPGHFWLKEKFWKNAPLGGKVLSWDLKSGKSIPYIYIPSKVQDNPKLLEKDPGYIDRLHMVGSPELVRAWLEGDFEIHQGAYFPEYGQRHIIEPFPIPKHWTRYMGFDWGYRNPFCAVWGAVSSGKYDDNSECPIPKGAIVIYREIWGKQQQNVDIAKRIAELSQGEDIHAAADPSIFKNDGGKSIADQFKEVFAQYNFGAFRPADNERVSGWAEIRKRLQPNPALLYFFTTCPYLIETLPGLVFDPKKPEDVDTDGEDHGADALRYLCKLRVIDPQLIIKEEPVKSGVVKVKQWIDDYRREQNRPKI